MIELPNIVVKLRELDDQLQRLARREDVKSEPLERNINQLNGELCHIIHDLERYVHTEMMHHA